MRKEGGGAIWEKSEPSEAGSDRPDVMTNQAWLTIPVNELPVAEGGRGLTVWCLKHLVQYVVSHCVRKQDEHAAKHAACERVPASQRKQQCKLKGRGSSVPYA